MKTEKKLYFGQYLSLDCKRKSFVRMLREIGLRNFEKTPRNDGCGWGVLFRNVTKKVAPFSLALEMNRRLKGTACVKPYKHTVTWMEDPHRSSSG